MLRRHGPLPGDAVSPAASYSLHRQRALASAFPTAVAVVVALTLLYAVAAILKSPGQGQILSYALELAAPLLALLLVRGPLATHPEGVALATDLCFTAVLSGRLVLPETTESGTALFLALKLLATAALFPWHPRLQYVSAASTMGLYFAAITLAGRHLNEIHQLAGPLIAAVLSCVGATIADRTRRALWQQSVDLAAAERRTRALLEAERTVAAENARLFAGLAVSEARYRDLFERATDLIFVVEEAGPLRFANRSALDFLRTDADRLNELRWQDLVTGRGRRRIERHLAIAHRRPGESDRTFQLEIAVPGAASAVLELRVRLISQAEQPAAYHCIARDVTERRQQERHTQQLLSKLREANRLQAEFVANMSHELRTPLNVIIGYGDLLADEPGLPAEGDAREFLGRIATAGRALHRLLESVLEYARLDRGHTAIIATRFPAARLLSELRDLCGDLRADGGVALAIQDTSDIVFISDYDRLYSILSNLLLNALKFTHAGRVELQLQRVGQQAEFIVRDTGIGIDADALAHVFEPFRQVDGSPTRIYGGVGLGLAIVRRNTELLRGEIEVESQLGAGTTFRIRVPVALADEAEEMATTTAA